MDIEVIKSRYTDYLNDTLGNLDLENQIVIEDVPVLIAEIERLRSLLTDGTCKDCGCECSPGSPRCRACTNRMMIGRKFTIEQRERMSKAQQARRDREYEKMLDDLG